MPTPPSDEPDATRKRVGKACDRCRLKKSKCDGAQPCARCKHEDASCIFGERKRIHDKTYPKGYVEMLERDRLKLTNGLQTLYKRALENGCWTGEPLKENSDGWVLTHDILERVGCLHAKSTEEDEDEAFEDDLHALQTSLSIKQGVQRHPTPPSATKSTFTFSGPGTPMNQNYNFEINTDQILFPLPALGPSPPLSSPSDSGEAKYGSSFSGVGIASTTANQGHTYSEASLVSPYQTSGSAPQWDQSTSFDPSINTWPPYITGNNSNAAQFNGYADGDLNRNLFDVS